MRRSEQKSWRKDLKPPQNPPNQKLADFTYYIRSMAQTIGPAGEGVLVLLGCLETFLERHERDLLRQCVNYKCVRHASARRRPSKASFVEVLATEIHFAEVVRGKMSPIWAKAESEGVNRAQTLKRLQYYLEQLIAGELTCAEAMEAERLAQRLDEAKV